MKMQFGSILHIFLYLICCTFGVLFKIKAVNEWSVIWITIYPNAIFCVLILDIKSVLDLFKVTI